MITAESADDDGDISTQTTIAFQPIRRAEIAVCCQICLLEDNGHGWLTTPIDARRFFLSLCPNHLDKLYSMTDDELAVAEELHYTAVLHWAYPYPERR